MVATTMGAGVRTKAVPWLTLLAVLLLGTACTLSSPLRRPPPAPIRIDPIRRVVPRDYVFEPDIAVDPTNPEHLAAIVDFADFPDCDAPPGPCGANLVLGTTADSGATWQDQRLTDFLGYDGSVSYASDGTLYEAGIVGDAFGGAFVHRGLPETIAGMTRYPRFSTPMADKPWLTVDQRTGALYLVYVGYDGTPPRVAVFLQSSTDGGRSWTSTVVVRSREARDDRGQAIGLMPQNPQALLGKDGRLAVVWAWFSPPEFVTTGRAEIQLATSEDGGRSFSLPRDVAESGGFQSSAFGSDGTYYVVFRNAEERLAIAASRDGGTSWATSVVRAEIPLYYSPIAPAAGIGVAPNGTLDVAFYAPTRRCTEPTRVTTLVLEQRWIDPCTYNVYYSASRDGGQTWGEPTQLNRSPLVGTRFVRLPAGRSRPGEYIGMASTNRYAYPIWIDTAGTDGTQALLVRIER